MTIALSIAVLGLAWLSLYLTTHGWANTVDRVAYWLHKYADGVRLRHTKSSNELAALWSKETV